MMNILNSYIDAETYGGDLDSTDDPGPSSSQSGGSFVNAGTYGCAFHPPIACIDTSKNPPDPNVSIGKIFSNIKDSQAELKELKKLKRFDPKFTFTVPYLGECVTNQQHFKPSDETHKCKDHITPSRVYYSQLMYKYGGVDLSKIYEPSTISLIYIDELLRIALPVFKGIQRMGVAGYAHVDIKPPNMLIDIHENPKILYLIDFGLLNKLTALKTQFYLHRHFYPYYPPEFKIFNCHRTGIYQIRTILQQCLDNFAYFNTLSFIHWISRRWPSYSYELQTTIQSFQNIPFKDFVKDFDNEIAPKVDSYGIAMSLIEVIYRFEVAYPKHIQIKSTPFFEQCLTTILFPMIDPNVYSRIPIDEAIFRLESLIKTYPDPTIPVKKTPSPIPPRRRAKKQPNVPGAPPILPSEGSPSIASPEIPVPIDKDACLKLKLTQLREIVEKHQLPKYGTKDVLCERIINALNQRHEEHQSAKKILKKIVQKDKKTKRSMEQLPPPENEIQREIDRLYIKPLHDCNKPADKGGYTIPELRDIARQLRLKHAVKRDEICKELQALRLKK